MGEINKLVVLWKGEPVIKQVVGNVSGSNVTEVVVVTGFEREKIEKILQDYSIKTVHNSGYNSGMTSSIKTGVGVDASDNGILICLGDMPSITREDYNKVLPVSDPDEKTIRIPVYKGRRGNPVYFSKHFKQSLLQHTSPDGCRGVLEENEDFIKEINMDTNHVLMDLDEPGDFSDNK